MLIFVSGHHPILGTQMLYFLDPVLTSWASVPPPTGLIALEDGRTIPQKAYDKTRRVISKPEIEEDETREHSEATEGFLEELQSTHREHEHAEESN